MGGHLCPGSAEGSLRVRDTQPALPGPERGVCPPALPRCPASPGLCRLLPPPDDPCPVAFGLILTFSKLEVPSSRQPPPTLPLLHSPCSSGPSRLSGPPRPSQWLAACWAGFSPALCAQGPYLERHEGVTCAFPRCLVVTASRGEEGSGSPRRVGQPRASSETWLGLKSGVWPPGLYSVQTVRSPVGQELPGWQPALPPAPCPNMAPDPSWLSMGSVGGGRGHRGWGVPPSRFSTTAHVRIPTHLSICLSVPWVGSLGELRPA